MKTICYKKKWLLRYLKNVLFSVDRSYTIEKKVLTEATLIKKSLYELKAIDEFTYFIVKRKTNLNVIAILISEEQGISKINFVDISSGKHLVIKAELNPFVNKVVDICSVLIEKADSLNNVDFPINNLISVLSIINEKFINDYSKKTKLLKFKHMTISKIQNENKDNFLCNCVPGFYPEREFYIRGKKVIDKYTSNPILPDQEQRLWEYLHRLENRKYIGIRKIPTLDDLFYGKRIMISINGFETVAIITKVKKINNQEQLLICIKNGDTNIDIPNPISKEELWKRVVSAR
jgi:hypothetical protein